MEPKKKSERIETGPLQINDDWPGYFIRGDAAFMLSFYISELIESHTEHRPPSPIYLAMVQSFAESLGDCDVRKNYEVRKIRTEDAP